MKQTRYCKLLPIVLLVAHSWLAHSQQQISQSSLFVEATNVMKGIGGNANRQLWVRLTQDGRLEWEEPGRGRPTHSSQLTPGQLQSLNELLKSIDWSRIHGEMGPYNVYIDSSVEVQIRIRENGIETSFLLSESLAARHQEEVSPGNLKNLLCELDRLHSLAAGGSVDRMCIHEDEVSPSVVQ